MWNKLLQKPKRHRPKPCGLGARDSLRIEAGLPLYGHELDGRFKISPFQAGYGWAVKLEKKFFIGKQAACKQAEKIDMIVARMELPGQKGIRPVRQNDPVTDKNNKVTGWVLSCATVQDRQIALALVETETAKEDETTGIYYLARSRSQIQQGKKQIAEKGELLKPDIGGRIISRFEKF